MKLVRFGELGKEKPGIIDMHGQIRDVSQCITDWAGENLHPKRLAYLSTRDLSTHPVVDDSVRLGPPVGEIPKLIGIGLNYTDHAAETGMDAPAEPIVFLKATSCICGP